MNKQLIRLMTALMLMMLSLCASALGEVRMEASVGYGGTILNGRWYPLEIQMRNEGDALSGELSVDLMQNYEAYDRYTLPVTLKAGETKTVRFPISTLMTQRTFEVSLCVEGEEVAAASALAGQAVSDEALTVGILCGDRMLVRSFSIDESNDVLGRDELITAVYLESDRFALSEKELDAFQVLAVSEIELDALGEERLALLDNWIQEGGVLILGSGCSEGWLEARTGIRSTEAAQSEDAVNALLAFTSSAVEANAKPMQVMPLSAGATGLVEDAAGQCLLAQSVQRNGLILACAFPLTDGQIAAQAAENALWQRLLLAVDAERYNNMFDVSHRRNYQYGSSINNEQWVSVGDSILPAILLLLAYTGAAGVGLFTWLKRRDRSRLLWICLPAAAIICTLLVVLLAGRLNLDAPTAASFRVTHYDLNGQADVEERALVSYHDQDRVTITTESGSRIERMEYGYFYGGSQNLDDATLRDTLILGELQGIELKPSAPWVARNLVIQTDKAPEGAVSGTAWMEADGLHAEIVNQTDLALEDALLFTPLGYVTIGDVAAGQTVRAHIGRPEQIIRKENGDQAILDGELLEFPAAVYSVARASACPEQETNPEFKLYELAETEYHAISLEQTKRSLASSRSAQGMPCVLYAQTPELPCEQLYKDGEPITRSAQVSITAADIRFITESPSGYVYYPQGTFAVHAAHMEDGKPIMAKAWEARYTEAAQGVYFGFDLSSAARVDISSIKLITEYDPPIRLAVFDHQLGDWVTLKAADHCVLDSTIIPRVIDEEGRLFIRYSEGDGQGGSVYSTQMIVEGSVKR